jgi:hypothetical protein
MVVKTSYYEASQLARLKALAGRLGKKEAPLLREALDDLLRASASGAKRSSSPPSTATRS